MYQGKNPTALQSQNLITEALLALMEEEPFQKITIKAVCAHAGVSRQTFYSLFENKEEVIGRRLDQLFEEYRKRFIEEKRAYTLRSLCDSIMECFVEQKKLLSLLVENHLDTLAREKSEAYLLHLDNIFHAYDHEDRDYAISFLAGAIISMVVYAIRRMILRIAAKFRILCKRSLPANILQFKSENSYNKNRSGF